MFDKNSPESFIWIFGYGSLMWRPGFGFLEQAPCVVKGLHRDLCILSYIYRGTPDVPGLVMGLCPGDQCQGIAFKVASEHKEDVFDYLYQREMPNGVYTPSWVEGVLEDGRIVSALTFIAREDHTQFVGHLPLQERLVYLLQGVGKGGTSIEYLKETRRHLQQLGITDPVLEDYFKEL